MKTLKITLSLVVVVLLTVSVVSTDTSVKDDAPTYKEYTPKDQIVLKRKKFKLESQV